MIEKMEKKYGSKMNRQEIMEKLGAWFGIKKNEDGEYNIDDYVWLAGCFINDKYMNLAEAVKFMETMVAGKMNRQEIMEKLGAWYGIKKNEDGEYNIDDYVWLAGCFINDKYMNLAEVVKFMETMMADWEERG